MPTTPLTLANGEAAALVGIATVSAAALAGTLGPLSPIAHGLALVGLAVPSYLGYKAYKTP